jgi:hypothetical protein
MHRYVTLRYKYIPNFNKVGNGRAKKKAKVKRDEERMKEKEIIRDTKREKLRDIDIRKE